ncbi:MAG: ADP-ribosylglycohydrolase family protein [Thermoleophilia bacterium]
MARDRFRGALLGLAVGEAMGAPAEFLTGEQIEERYGLITEMLGGGVYEVAAGETVDATGMMLCLAESLADAGRFDPEDIIERYRQWFDRHPVHVSLTVRAALLSYRAGTHWDVASRRAFEILGGPTAGNGSLIRSAPLGLLYHRDAELRRELSHRESMLTHFDRLAGWACAAFTDLLAAALRGDVRGQVQAVAAGLDDEDSRVSAALRSTLEAAPEEIRSSSFVLDTLQTALWTVLQGTGFEPSIVAAVNLGSDACAVGAVAGALAGALHGEADIPPRWRDALVGGDRIVAVADRLWEIAAAS